MKRHLTHLSALMGTGLLVCAPFAIAGLQAPPNIIIVTTTSDGINHFDGLCSLREALDNASRNVQGSPIDGECPTGSASAVDVIVLEGGATYLLTAAGIGETEGDLNAFQQTPLSLDLRIETSGEGQATIQQTINGQRVLHLDGITVELDNLIIRGGRAGGDVGGGIYNNGGVLTVSDSTILVNEALSGAGIYNDGQLTVQNSEIVLNKASLIGGGILNDTGRQLNIVNSQLRANEASAGGGIYNSGFVGVGTGSAINLNKATAGDGGGIQNNPGSTITIASATTFEGNSAAGVGAGRGGAIWHNSTGSIELTNSDFSGNRARLGGAVQVPNDTPLQVSGSTFSDNQATADGGALHAVFLNVENSMFDANSAGTSGGAILIQSVGGVSNSSFSLNSAAAGGAIQAQTLSLTDSYLSENTAFGGGGAVAASDSVSIDNSHFDTNAAGIGGALSIDQNGNPSSITRSRFIGNTATDGGGAYIESTASITRSLFTDNTATGKGGGLYIRSTSSIANTTIHSNPAAEGGLYIHAAGDVTALNMTLTGHLQGQDLHKLGTLRMGNSIIFTPGQPDCVTTLDEPPIITLGHNIVDDTSCFFDQTLDSDQLLTDPMLDELADNGGGTQTQALTPGSPALDAGDNALCDASPVGGVDQRGAPRPVGATCDIGAHEQGAVAPAVDEIFRNGFEAM